MRSVLHGPDAAVAELAARQYGVVTRAQLSAAGLGRGAIRHRLERGRLHALHRGVYAVGHPALPHLGREAAALLACGGSALLSHRSAGERWGILPAAEADIDVTVVARNPRTRAGIQVHRVRRLDRRDRSRRDRLPVTAPLRTLVDLADVLARRRLERALDEAQVRRLVRVRDLLRVEAPGRTGGRVIRELAERAHGPTLTRSEAEERLLALVRAAGLDEPEVNQRVAGHEVDFLWRAARLVVEVDGYAFHSTRAAFERDRRRDGHLQSRGLTVMRVTWRQLTDEREAVLARLAQRLSSCEWR